MFVHVSIFYVRDILSYLHFSPGRPTLIRPQSEGANELLVPSGDALVTTSDAPVTSSFLFLVAMHLLLLAMHLLLVASCFVLGFCNTIQCVFIVFVGRSNIVCPLRWNCANLVLDFDPTRNEMIVFSCCATPAVS